jgi:hypothetical protein
MAVPGEHIPVSSSSIGLSMLRIQEARQPTSGGIASMAKTRFLINEIDGSVSLFNNKTYSPDVALIPAFTALAKPWRSVSCE